MYHILTFYFLNYFCFFYFYTVLYVYLVFISTLLRTAASAALSSRTHTHIFMLRLFRLSIDKKVLWLASSFKCLLRGKPYYTEKICTVLRLLCSYNIKWVINNKAERRIWTYFLPSWMVCFDQLNYFSIKILLY